MKTEVDKTTDINPTDYPVHTLIRRRWSPRSFANKPVDTELLRQLFDAARWAPSSYNEQPWRFIVATHDQPEEYNRLLHVILPGNQRWAQDAPALAITAVKTNFDRNSAENRAAEHDLGQAVGYLTLEAMRHDLYVHQMAGISQSKAREAFNIPEGYIPFTALAIGYLDEDASLPSGRSRKDLDKVVFRGTWDERRPVE